MNKRILLTLAINFAFYTQTAYLYQKITNYFQKPNSQELIDAYFTSPEITYEEYATQEQSDKERNLAFNELWQMKIIDQLTPLIDQGAYVDSITSDNYTLFEDAVIKNSFKIADYLLSKGAKINRQANEEGDTFLMTLAEDHNLPAIKYLLTKNPRIINHSNPDKQTALMMAAAGEQMLESSELPFAPSLPKYTDQLTTEELTPGFKITRDPYKEYISQIKAVQSKQAHRLKVLDKNIKSRLWNDALYLPIVKYLVSQGANINAEDAGGWTALDYAEMNHNKRIAQFLKEQGGIAMRNMNEQESLWDMLAPNPLIG